MESFYVIIALLTAGGSLVIGSISLAAALQKGGIRLDLFFGIMSLSLFVFLILPPIGFVIIDKAPYPGELVFKRIFIAAYYILFPWFLELYTGFKKRIVLVAANASMVVSYTLMAFTPADSPKPLWVFFALATFTLNVCYGFYLVRKQMNAGGKSNANWLLAALVPYAMLLLAGMINQFGNNYFGRMLGSKLFFPFNFHSLAFIIIMGIRLRVQTFEKYKLEKSLHLSDARWHSLLQNLDLISVELSRTGIVKYINPYTLKSLGYQSEDELLGKDWFVCCLTEAEAKKNKPIFDKMIKDEQVFSNFKVTLCAKNGDEIIAAFTNVFIYDDQGIVQRIIGIGVDMTGREKAFREIQRLKNELEKENLQLKAEPPAEWIHPEIIGESGAIKYAIQRARQAAPTNASILLEGETGVGKELFADFIYRFSDRYNKPFIKVNCGALPAELIESELFGYEKGAFTGATQSKKGRFELADGGTIFLDEIGELPLVLQPKLLRILQNGEFQKLGGVHTIKVNVRVISATHRNLEKETKQGKFREDLFYRLNVFPITIPALRNRMEDIPLLIKFHIKKINLQYGKEIEEISKADITRLCEYSWPGNVRELENVIERSVISSTGKILRLDWVGDHSGFLPLSHSASSLEQIEKEHIQRMLLECGGRINGEHGAAEKLGMNPNTLRSRMKKLNIERLIKTQED